MAIRRREIEVGYRDFQLAMTRQALAVTRGGVAQPRLIVAVDTLLQQVDSGLVAQGFGASDLHWKLMKANDLLENLFR